jgi:hypothetical protein
MFSKVTQLVISLSQKKQQETCEIFKDFIIFIFYMSKFSKYKTRVLNQKRKIILIIQCISAQATQVLRGRAVGMLILGTPHFQRH